MEYTIRDRGRELGSFTMDQIESKLDDHQIGMMAEAYDGKWSGAGTGFMLGAFLALTAVLLMIVSSLAGVGPRLATMMTENIAMYAGGLAGIAIIFGMIGMFIGKASE